MKRSSSISLVVLFIILFVLPEITYSRRIHRAHSYRNTHRTTKERMRSSMRPRGGRPAMKLKGSSGPDTVEIAGSRLPDCSHACGSCSPCRLVMVSFVCAALEEAETCPMAYKCMCKNKSYPVP